MRFEVLKRSNLKRNIMIGVVVVAIIIVCVITLTRAKYRSVASTTLINEEVEYSLTDENLVAVYLQKEEDGEEYTQDKEIPTSGYTFNAEDSYCTVDGEIDDSITLSYDSTTQSLSVSPITTQGTKCYLYFDIQGTLLSDAILTDKTFKTRSLPFSDITTVSGITATTGVIYMSGDEDNEYDYDNDGVVYYFAGNPTDNYVEFAGVYWRIVRINGDGTIRLIYQGKSTTATGSDATIGSSAFNEQYDASYYVGYTYSAGYQRGNDSESTIKGVLDKWYEENLKEKYASYIADSGFCNDREMADGYIWDATPSSNIYYAAHDRVSLRSINPTFKCTKEDLYTVSNSKGNGYLKYPIGLITADEAVYAGLASDITCIGNYLLAGSNYWTMSPLNFSSAGEAHVFAVESTGYLYIAYDLNSEYGVRPVINLRSDVTISGGNGEADNPYIVVTS